MTTTCLDIPNARHEAAASAPFLDVWQCEMGNEYGIALASDEMIA